MRELRHESNVGEDLYVYLLDAMPRAILAHGTLERGHVQGEQYVRSK